MLIRYSVSNFRSYKNEATLDFITNSKISTNKSHEYRFGRLSVLKNIGIFGSNAYGKSNLIKSIQAMQLIISRNLTPENFSFVGQEDIPTTFRMLFSIEDNEFYEYSFSIVRIPNSVCFNVVDEELYIIEENDYEVALNKKQMEFIIESYHRINDLLEDNKPRK